MTSEELKIFCDAIRTFGMQKQILMVFEEMAELQKELCKYLRNGESDEAVCRVAEELADVEIMLDQKQGNMLQAAIYEQQRNEKIDGEKLGYAKTSKYAQYLPGASSVGTDYMDDLKKTMGGKFSWDADKDESVGAYRKQYLREADRTMQDTLAKYGTMTGGIPSSQAVTAASQQADYYKSQLADKIPELRDSAWSKYAQEKQRS